MSMMRTRIWRILPVLVLWLDLLYGFVLNIGSSLSQVPAALPVSALPVSPNIAFSWLQVLTNGVMLLTLSYAFVTLMQLNRAVSLGLFWPLTAGRIFGLCVVLVFSLPSWWQWFYAICDTLRGEAVIAWRPWRYLVTTLLLPYPAALCLRLLCGRRWRRPAVPPAAEPQLTADAGINGITPLQR